MSRMKVTFDPHDQWNMEMMGGCGGNLGGTETSERKCESKAQRDGPYFSIEPPDSSCFSILLVVFFCLLSYLAWVVVDFFQS